MYSTTKEASVSNKTIDKVQADYTSTLLRAASDETPENSTVRQAILHSPDGAVIQNIATSIEKRSDLQKCADAACAEWEGRDFDAREEGPDERLDVMESVKFVMDSYAVSEDGLITTNVAAEHLSKMDAARDRVNDIRRRVVYTFTAADMVPTFSLICYILLGAEEQALVPLVPGKQDFCASVLAFKWSTVAVMFAYNVFTLVPIATRMFRVVTTKRRGKRTALPLLSTTTKS